MKIWQVRGEMNAVLTGAAGQFKYLVAIFKIPFKYFQDNLLIILAGLAKGEFMHRIIAGHAETQAALVSNSFRYSGSQLRQIP